MIINSKLSKYILLEKLGLLVNKEIHSDFNHLIKNDLHNYKKDFIVELKKYPTDYEIDDKLSNVSNLVFGITEDCNLRCKYCIYSGKYIGQRNHSSNRLSFETAIKAVDLFLKYINMSGRMLNLNKIDIGFYGGEPLLENKLINKIIEYIKTTSLKLRLNKKYNFNFTMSTNGIILNKSMIDFVVKNHISTSVSIDGYKDIHDKFRVNANNEGSWETVIKNLKDYKSRYPKEYKNNVNFLCTVHPLTDGEMLDQFFLSNQDLFDINKIQFSDLMMKDLDESFKELISKDQGKYTNSYLQFERIININFNKERFNLNILRPKINLTGACFPGQRKFFISTDGSIHICEKMNPDFPIGNVFTGINYNAIRNIIKTYNNEIINKKCWECPVWFLCNTCYAVSTTNKEIELFCPKDNIINFLSQLVSYKEMLHEKNFNNFAINSIGDYLSSLQ
jgi:uncharacterized protein